TTCGWFARIVRVRSEYVYVFHLGRVYTSNSHIVLSDSPIWCRRSRAAGPLPITCQLCFSCYRGWDCSLYHLGSTVSIGYNQLGISPYQVNVASHSGSVGTIVCISIGSLR